MQTKNTEIFTLIISATRSCGYEGYAKILEYSVAGRDSALLQRDDHGEAPAAGEQ